MKQVYLSANHISKSNASLFLDAMQRYKVTHLLTYTSSVTFLAQQILEQELEVKHQLKVIITNAEPLFPWQRIIIEKAFQCPVRETYGMGEIVATASADSINQLRNWPEVGVIEVYDDESLQKLPVGTVGRFICTGLFNPDMPLIRYQVGDRGSLSLNVADPNDRIQLPYLGRIEGRSNDLLVTQDGRKVFWINPVFYGLPVVEAQIIQTTINEIIVRIVPDITFNQDVKVEITNRLKQILGDKLTLRFEEMTKIPRGENNKFKQVISNL